MRKYKDSGALFTDEIDVYENTDPVDADSVDNVPLIQLYGNTIALKRGLDEKSEALTESISGVYGFADQVLAAAILSYQRLARIMTFQYDPAAGEISTWGGASFFGDTAFLLDGSYDEETETVSLQADSDFDFGADGFLYNRSRGFLVSPAGNSADGETYVFAEGMAEQEADETIKLLSAEMPDYTPGGGSPYVLPTATATRLGGVKIGNGVTVNEDGTISFVVPESTAEEAAGIAEEKMTGEGNDLSDDDVDYIVGD